MAGRILTGRRGPFPTRVIPEESNLVSQQLPQGIPEEQPLPEIGEQFAPTQLPSSKRFFMTEEPGQAPKLSNVPTGSPYERELQLPEQRTMELGGQQVTVSGDRPLDEGGLRQVGRALAPPTEETAPQQGTALEQAQDLFNQLEAAGVASEFEAAMRETGLDQKIALEEAAMERAPEAAGISGVQSSTMHPGGLGATIVRDDGTVELVTLKEAEKELIKSVEKSDAELQGFREGERGAARLAIAKSKEAFGKMTLTQENIAAMGDAIAEIDAGAKAGFIESKLPSIRASSIRLENIQKQLGLNVIGGVTFGALSKGELDLAMSKALPTGLNETDLRDWLVAKKTAQEKLVNNLQDAAIFLGTPPNTIADFLARNKEQAQPEVAPAQGGGEISQLSDAELQAIIQGG